MEMKKCPICKKDIASDATTCPHCGHNLVNKEKELPILLKRAQVSYLLDILIMVLPLSLILLMLLNKFLLILAIPLSLLTLVWGFLSIKKKRINNHILKDLIYFNKKDNQLIIYPLDHHEYKINTNKNNNGTDPVNFRESFKGIKDRYRIF